MISLFFTFAAVFIWLWAVAFGTYWITERCQPKNPK
jgi:hypothetical protein